jgi:hypothetical protein
MKLLITEDQLKKILSFPKKDLNESFFQNISNLFKSKNVKDWEKYNTYLINNVKDKTIFDNLSFEISENLQNFFKYFLKNFKENKIVNPFISLPSFYNKLTDNQLSFFRNEIDNTLSSQEESSKEKSEIDNSENNVNSLIEKFESEYNSNTELINFLKPLSKKSYDNPIANFINEIKNFLENPVSERNLYEGETKKSIKDFFYNYLNLRIETNTETTFEYTFKLLKTIDKNFIDKIISFFSDKIEKIKNFEGVYQNFIQVKEGIRDLYLGGNFNKDQFAKLKEIESKIHDLGFMKKIKTNENLKALGQLYNLVLTTPEDYLDSITITTGGIIKENGLTNEDLFFTHSSTNPNLSKGSISFEPSERGEFFITDENTPDDRYGFYLTVFKKNERKKFDALHYLKRAENLEWKKDKLKTYLYVISVQPQSRFLNSHKVSFTQTNESTKSFADFCISLGLSGYYNHEPYGSDSAMELVIVDKQCISNVQKVDLKNI